MILITPVGDMAQKKRAIRFLFIFLLFVVYFLAAARPVPREVILAPVWISSVEAESPVLLKSSHKSGQLLPFTLGSRFGYIDSSGQFAVNKIKNSDIYLDEKMWTETGTTPSGIEIKNISQETVINIENARGYPVLLDNRIFILGNNQNELSEIKSDGSILWTYEYGSPLTCIDSAAGLVLTGSLDGMIEILDSNGNRIYYFEPGGSRFDVILGCAISGNGSRVGIICGIERQRFVLLERFANTNEYRVVYHEFFETDFRRPVRISFIDEDRRIVFEREGGLGCYSIRSRRAIFIPLDGEIAAIDNSGDQGLLFLIISRSMQRKELIGIKIPQDNMFSGSAGLKNIIFIRAPFRSDDVFLGRTDSMFVAGGGKILISFNLEEK
jgi:hypothetical protein